MKIRILAGLLAMLGAAASTHAQVTVAVVCDPIKMVPILQVSYGTGRDAGKPGLFWIGVLSEDQRSGAVLTTKGWEGYEGGLYPYQSRFDMGLTPIIKLNTPLPGKSTSPWAGYTVFAGHGVYTPDSRQKVASRRATLDSTKELLISKGGWRPEYETDDYYMWTLVQRDMVNGNKYGPIFTIPNINCTMQEGG